MPGLVFEIFEVELQNILYNLFDPAYLPEAQVYPVFQLTSSQGPDALRAKIVAAIDNLRSGVDYPQRTKSDLLYEILTARFIRGLSQEKAAELLDLSTRHLRRKQNEAIHALATRVWQAYQVEREPQPSSAQAEVVGGEDVSWEELMSHELELLHTVAPDTSADLAETFQRVVDLAAYLPDIAAVHLQAAPLEVGVRVPVHAAVLQQVLLNLITHLLHIGYRGRICLTHNEGAASIAVCLALDPAPAPAGLDAGPLRALTTMLGAEFETQQSAEDFTIRLVFEKVRRVSVLVVDDNSQVVQLYQRYTANTRYDITHLASGAGLLERLQTTPVDILMIDILLPDIDGWELLLQLRRNPATARTPVIICSVLGNKEMARTLGAARYLPKPIDRQALLTALDEISAGRWQAPPPAQTPT